ncbi:MAG: YqgE/AlgH family protein [Gammaproteobacteria bacterium]|nr:YqgE/AlgH family protein [Gammaproteobacteria bacterium]
MDLTNQFLIAMPSLEDPNFSRTVTYVCVHNAEGAMGIVINRPLDLTVGEVLSHMEIDVLDERARQMQVVSGGPVQRERGFVLHQPCGTWDSVLEVADGIGVATSRDILDAVARGEGPEHALLALGYAGWGAGQLEQEVQANAWLSAPAQSRIIFDLPYSERWAQATRSLGIAPEQLLGDAGHA